MFSSQQCDKRPGMILIIIHIAIKSSKSLHNPSLVSKVRFTIQFRRKENGKFAIVENIKIKYDKLQPLSIHVI